MLLLVDCNHYSHLWSHLDYSGKKPKLIAEQVVAVKPSDHIFQSPNETSPASPKVICFLSVSGGVTTSGRTRKGLREWD